MSLRHRLRPYPLSTSQDAKPKMEPKRHASRQPHFRLLSLSRSRFIGHRITNDSDNDVLSEAASSLSIIDWGIASFCAQLLRFP